MTDDIADLRRQVEELTRRVDRLDSQRLELPPVSLCSICGRTPASFVCWHADCPSRRPVPLAARTTP